MDRAALSDVLTQLAIAVSEVGESQSLKQLRDALYTAAAFAGNAATYHNLDGIRARLSIEDGEQTLAGDIVIGALVAQIAAQRAELDRRERTINALEQFSNAMWALVGHLDKCEECRLGKPCADGRRRRDFVRNWANSLRVNRKT